MIEQLKATGKVSHAYLGVQTQDGSGAGAQVAGLTANGPAATGGLQVGDVITSLGGKSVEDSTTLSTLVDQHKVGDSVAVKVTRNGQTKSLTVKLGQRPDTTASTDSTQQQAPQRPRSSRTRSRVRVRPADASGPELRRRLVARRRGRSARGAGHRAGPSRA